MQQIDEKIQQIDEATDGIDVVYAKTMSDAEDTITMESSTGQMQPRTISTNDVEMNESESDQGVMAGDVTIVQIEMASSPDNHVTAMHDGASTDRRTPADGI